MLRAYSNMSAEEFIAQLRVYVIAMGLGPQVVHAVDNLKGIDDEEDTHATELAEAEGEGEKIGRESMKQEMVDCVTRWLENEQDNYDENAHAEAILKLLEAVEV